MGSLCCTHCKLTQLTGSKATKNRKLHQLRAGARLKFTRGKVRRWKELSPRGGPGAHSGFGLCRTAAPSRSRDADRRGDGAILVSALQRQRRHRIAVEYHAPGILNIGSIVGNRPKGVLPELLSLSGHRLQSAVVAGSVRLELLSERVEIASLAGFLQGAYPDPVPLTRWR